MTLEGPPVMNGGDEDSNSRNRAESLREGSVKIGGDFDDARASKLDVDFSTEDRFNTEGEDVEIKNRELKKEAPEVPTPPARNVENSVTINVGGESVENSFNIDGKNTDREGWRGNWEKERPEGYKSISERRKKLKREMGFSLTKAMDGKGWTQEDWDRINEIHNKATREGVLSKSDSDFLLRFNRDANTAMDEVEGKTLSGKKEAKEKNRPTENIVYFSGQDADSSTSGTYSTNDFARSYSPEEASEVIPKADENRENTKKPENTSGKSKEKPSDSAPDDDEESAEEAPSGDETSSAEISEVEETVIEKNPEEVKEVPVAESKLAKENRVEKTRNFLGSFNSKKTEETVEQRIKRLNDPKVKEEIKKKALESQRKAEIRESLLKKAAVNLKNHTEKFLRDKWTIFSEKVTDPKFQERLTTGISSVLRTSRKKASLITALFVLTVSLNQDQTFGQGNASESLSKQQRTEEKTEVKTSVESKTSERPEVSEDVFEEAVSSPMNEVLTANLMNSVKEDISPVVEKTEPAVSSGVEEAPLDDGDMTEEGAKKQLENDNGNPNESQLVEDDSDSSIESGLSDGGIIDSVDSVSPLSLKKKPDSIPTSDVPEKVESSKKIKKGPPPVPTPPKKPGILKTGFKAFGKALFGQSTSRGRGGLEFSIRENTRPVRTETRQQQNNINLRIGR